MAHENEATERVTYWYDRPTRSWVIQRLDGVGNQISDATYIGNGEEAARLVARQIADRCGGVPVEKMSGN